MAPPQQNDLSALVAQYLSLLGTQLPKGGLQLPADQSAVQAEKLKLNAEGNSEAQASELVQLYRYAVRGEFDLTIVRPSGTSCTFAATPWTTALEVMEEVTRQFDIPVDEQRLLAGTTELACTDFPARYVTPFTAELTVLRVEKSFDELVRTAPRFQQKEMLKERLLPKVKECLPEMAAEATETMLEGDVEELLRLVCEAGSADQLQKTARAAARTWEVRNAWAQWR